MGFQDAGKKCIFIADIFAEQCNQLDPIENRVSVKSVYVEAVYLKALLSYSSFIYHSEYDATGLEKCRKNPLFYSNLMQILKIKIYPTSYTE